MAISPHVLIDELKSESDRFEKIIDERLKHHRISKGETVTIYIPDGMTKKHFPYIAEKYLKVDWSQVEFRDDFRNGSYLEFKY